MMTKLNPLTRKIILIFAVIFLVFSAGLFYINKVLLPVQIKAMVTQAAEKALHRKVTLGSLQYSPLNGFVVTHLFIADKTDAAKPFFQADTISVQVLSPALLQKKIIITSLNIISPAVRLTRTAKDIWNFSDLILPAATPAKTTATPLAVVISGFAATNAVIELDDTSLADNFHETFSLPEIKGGLTFDGTLRVAGNMVFPATSGTLQFDIRSGLNDNAFKGTFALKDIAVSRYLRFSPAAIPDGIKNLVFARGAVNMDMRGGKTTVAGDLDMPGTDLDLPGTGSFQGDLSLAKITAVMAATGISVEGSIQATQVKAALPDQGPAISCGSFSAPLAKAEIKNGKLSASADISVKELALRLNPEQEMKTGLTLEKLAITSSAKGYDISALIRAEDLTLSLGQGQSLSGSIILKEARAAIAGTSLQFSADIDIPDATATAAGATLSASLSAPDTRLAFDTGRLDARVHALFRKLSVKAPQGITATGTPELAASLTLDPNAAARLVYAGTLDLAGASLAGLPLVDAVKDIRGTVSFDTGKASTRQMTFNVLNTPFTISGELSHFEAPVLDLHATTDELDLALVEKVLPDIVKQLELSIKGKARGITLDFTGPLAAPATARIKAAAALADVALDSRKLKQSASAISGQFTYEAPLLTWKNVSADCLGRTWTSEGTLKDFTNPDVSVNIRAQDLNADLKAVKTGDKVVLAGLSGTWAGARFKLNGDIFLPPGAKPRLAIEGEFKAGLESLAALLTPEQARQVNALKLTGDMTVKAAASGILEEWQDMTTSLSVSIPALGIMGYKITDLDMNAQQKDGRLDPVTVNGKVYGGNLNITGTVALKEKHMPFTTAVKLDATSLELLKMDTPLRQKQFSGLLSAGTDIEGKLLDIRKMTGKGHVKVTNGYLWELEIFSKMLSLLSSSFQGGDLIITSADATFKIADAKIMTKDLALHSTSVTLGGEGWVDFDQKIDLNISPRVEAAATARVADPISALNPTAGIVNIRIHNTLTAPKFEHNISAPQIIQKTLQNTVGSLLKLFE